MPCALVNAVAIPAPPIVDRGVGLAAPFVAAAALSDGAAAGGRAAVAAFAAASLEAVAALAPREGPATTPFAAFGAAGLLGADGLGTAAESSQAPAARAPATSALSLSAHRPGPCLEVGSGCRLALSGRRAARGRDKGAGAGVRAVLSSAAPPEPPPEPTSTWRVGGGGGGVATSAVVVGGEAVGGEVWLRAAPSCRRTVAPSHQTSGTHSGVFGVGVAGGGALLGGPACRDTVRAPSSGGARGDVGAASVCSYVSGAGTDGDGAGAGDDAGDDGDGDDGDGDGAGAVSVCLELAREASPHDSSPVGVAEAPS